MTAPPDPLTVETRLRWIEGPLVQLYAGKIAIGDVWENTLGEWVADHGGRPRTRYPTEAEARAALIAAAMEDLKDVG